MNRAGYFQGEVSGKFYLVHRVAWLLHYGEWPKGDIDHINGITTDNRIENLRVVTMAENQQNRTLACKSQSGIRGVDFQKREGKWRARIKAYGKPILLGMYETKEEARDAYLLAKREFHKVNPVPRDVSAEGVVR